MPHTASWKGAFPQSTQTMLGQLTLLPSTQQAFSWAPVPYSHASALSTTKAPAVGTEVSQPCITFPISRSSSYHHFQVQSIFSFQLQMQSPYVARALNVIAQSHETFKCLKNSKTERGTAQRVGPAEIPPLGAFSARVQASEEGPKTAPTPPVSTVCTAGSHCCLLISCLEFICCSTETSHSLNSRL